MNQYEASLSQDTLILSDVDNEFIHFSTMEQVLKVIGKFCPNESVMILYIDPTLLPGELILEANPGGSGEKYYHLYNGSIPMNTVKLVYRYEPVPVSVPM